MILAFSLAGFFYWRASIWERRHDDAQFIIEQQEAALKHMGEIMAAVDKKERMEQSRKESGQKIEEEIRSVPGSNVPVGPATQRLFDILRSERSDPSDTP